MALYLGLKDLVKDIAALKNEVMIKESQILHFFLSEKHI